MFVVVCGDTEDLRIISVGTGGIGTEKTFVFKTAFVGAGITGVAGG